MQVRSARDTDIAWLSKVLRQIADESPGGLFVVPEEDAFRGMLTAIPYGGILIVSRDGHDVGILVLNFSRALFNPLVTVATVVCWWVEPGERGFGAGAALMLRAERAAREYGCRHLSIFIADDPDGGVSIAKRLGFIPLERVYYKEVR